MDRQLVTLYALDRTGAERVLPELARALRDGSVGRLDEAGMVEVEVTAPTREQAIGRVRDAIAATGADERFTFPATTGTEHVPRDDPEGTARERPERERTSMDREPPRAEDPLLRREERAAAAEAGRIGGPAPDTEGDEADRPVEEAGGGEAEGFETAERELVEQASHGENRWTPEEDAFTPEGERDRPAAADDDAPLEDLAPDARGDRAAQVHGEPDEVDPTEVVRDPKEGPDDPGEGPGLASER
jgi:hypothetical protein